MGGIGSGHWYRWDTKPVIEDGLVLNLGRCVKQRLLREGVAGSGSLVWSSVYDGERVANIGYSFDMRDPLAASMTLDYTVTRRGEGPVKIRDTIALEYTQPTYGGRRWWFRCPHTNKRAAKLYLPSGALYFRHRKAYRMAYRSQNEQPYERYLSKAQDIRLRLGGPVSTLDYFPDKPKGMHWKTYERLSAEAERAERLVDYYTMQRFGGMRLVGGNY